MTEIFAADGRRTPVTMIEAGPCVVAQVKSKEKDGYVAVQVGFDKIADKKIKKSQTKKPYRVIKEYRIEGTEEPAAAGSQLDVACFAEGDVVKISGFTKGKGFQGAVKKHGFKGRLSVTHGTKHELRNIGSMGMGGASLRKGKKMPGRMGAERVTLRNVKIVKVDPEKNLLAVKGAVPGPKGTLVEIRG